MIRQLLIMFTLGASSLVWLQGCSYVPSITPHKIDIQQGNDVTEQMLSQVKVGMTQNQVRFLLGTPLLRDIFHKQRWDYPYLYYQAGTLKEKRLLSLTFNGEILTRIEIDPPLPTTTTPLNK